MVERSDTCGGPEGPQQPDRPPVLSSAWFRALHGRMYFSDIAEPIPGCPGSFCYDEQPDPERILRHAVAEVLEMVADEMAREEDLSPSVFRTRAAEVKQSDEMRAAECHEELTSGDEIS